MVLSSSRNNIVSRITDKTINEDITYEENSRSRFSCAR